MGIFWVHSMIIPFWRSFTKDLNKIHIEWWRAQEVTFTTLTKLEDFAQCVLFSADAIWHHDSTFYIQKIKKLPIVILQVQWPKACWHWRGHYLWKWGLFASNRWRHTKKITKLTPENGTKIQEVCRVYWGLKLCLWRRLKKAIYDMGSAVLGIIVLSCLLSQKWTLVYYIFSTNALDWHIIGNWTRSII